MTEFKGGFKTLLHLFNLLLLSSTSHGTDNKGRLIVWSDQYMQTASLETTLKNSASECARRHPLNPKCRQAFCETANKKCYALSEVDSFTSGMFEPGNDTIFVSIRYVIPFTCEIFTRKLFC